MEARVCIVCVGYQRESFGSRVFLLARLLMQLGRSSQICSASQSIVFESGCQFLLPGVILCILVEEKCAVT